MNECCILSNALFVPMMWSCDFFLLQPSLIHVVRHTGMYVPRGTCTHMQTCTHTHTHTQMCMHAFMLPTTGHPQLECVQPWGFSCQLLPLLRSVWSLKWMAQSQSLHKTLPISLGHLSSGAPAWEERSRAEAGHALLSLEFHGRTVLAQGALCADGNVL